MAQQRNMGFNTKAHQNVAKFDPIEGWIQSIASNADAEDKRIKNERAAFDRKGLNEQKESKLVVKEKGQRAIGSGLQSSATNNTSLLR